ncbi:hypothetical protein P780_16145, partial [Vibrio mimicus CAIM 1882]
WLNQQFDLRFLILAAKFQSLIFKNYESFQFFRFCLLLANPSRVNLGFGKNVGVEA